jgi:hypothetical protein
VINTLKFIAAVSVWFLVAAGVVRGASTPPPEGGVLPEIVLTVPENTGHREYLGLAGKKTFKIPDIKSEIVLIEIFSMY